MKNILSHLILQFLIPRANLSHPLVVLFYAYPKMYKQYLYMCVCIPVI